MLKNWIQIADEAQVLLRDKELGELYQKRLDFELQEIDKQGANIYWTNLINSNIKFKSNPNHLLLPWLYGLVSEDPIVGRKDQMLCTTNASKLKEFYDKHKRLPSDIIKDQDMPDIDLDVLPEARDPIKEYAMSKYGSSNDNEYGPVCSVGTWQTYKFKSAIMDVGKALAAVDPYEVYELTTKLPEDVDGLKDNGYATCKGRLIDGNTGQDIECGEVHDKAKCPKCNSPDTDSPTLGKLLIEYENLNTFAIKYPKVIEYAVKLVGRVRNMGMHAGALIIADRDLYGNIPMAKNGNRGYWVSMWTEGRNTQLSKFGYCKWDVLGLKTLEYIFRCSKFIEENRGISFGPNAEGWDDIDPINNIAGHYFDGEGKKCYIDLNDEYALSLANEQKTDAIFQFDTDLSKSLLSHGVRHFNDLMLINAMGHPGPMASIPEAMQNRDDVHGKWKHRLHPDILEILKDTYGVIVYQEQLQAIWQKVAGFTAPEAQEARKAVAKKWAHKLKPIKAKWLEGATSVLGAKEAVEWWDKMESFGRYAFNKSHSVSYCLVTLRCLWLKAHFAPEYWAAVMSDCHPDKLVRYMSVARSEDWKPTNITQSGRSKTSTNIKAVKFGTININNLSSDYTVSGNVVNQGLIGIKKIGEKAAESFCGKGEWNHIDEFVNYNEKRKNKIVLERFIKLGAFSHLPNHGNTKALWDYYQYKYSSGNSQLKSEIKIKLLEKEGWNDKTIAEERQRQIKEYLKLYPNRKKIPNKFNTWVPKADDTFDNIIALYEEDFTFSEKLSFQKEFLGFYLDSPLELFDLRGGCSIKDAKNAGLADSEYIIESMILSIEYAMTKPKNNKEPTQYAKLTVTDGVQRTVLFMWNNELANTEAATLKPGVGIRVRVKYDKQRSTFTVSRGASLIKLRVK